nr:hypothetical protein [Tanacetum cinerariifolium]
EECPKNPGLGATKNWMKPSHATRGVPVGPKVGFKPTKEYRPVSKNPTTNTHGNKKKGMNLTKKGEDDVESIDNDMAHSMASECVGFDTKNLLE